MIGNAMGHLYSPMKIFHYKDKIDSLPHSVEEILPPIHVRIKPTNVCNHRCRYCAYRAADLQLGKDMVERDTIGRDKMREIIEDVAGMGVLAITFSGGGEPFCYPHLLETAQWLVDSKLSFAALTNGSRVQGAIAELFAHCAAWLRISIDGWDDASYSCYRDVPIGEFTKVLQNMRQFRRLGGTCYTGASVIVDQTNAEHIFELIERLVETGIHSVKVSPCIISNSGRENNDYHTPFFKRVKEQIARAMDSLAGPGFEVFDSYHRQLESFHKAYSWCPYLQILPVIGADLNVYSCQDKAYNLQEGLLGSIRNQRFHDFWLTGKDQFFRINPSVHCDHHCVADTKNRMLHEYLAADQEHRMFV